MITYAFWNNKGGTGKTSLAFQSITRYAERNHSEKILAIDLCPQANLSELMLGGLNNKGSHKLLHQHSFTPRRSIGGYFQLRLPSPYISPDINCNEFITVPHDFNRSIPRNIELICGDPLLELQANAVNTLANQNIPGTDTWISVIDWINDMLRKLNKGYDKVFLDCNPSFSMFTQMALASSDRLILPVMADDSSRRAIQNAISLIYGLKLPDEIYATYMFKAKLDHSKRKLPKIHLIAKNRLTQYMGAASAYAAVLKAIEADVTSLSKSHPELFTFADANNGFVDIRDFQTTGVVAFAQGQPFSKVSRGKHQINDKDIQIKDEYLSNCLNAIDDLVCKL